MTEPGVNTSPANQSGKCKCGKKLVKKQVELGFCAECYKTECNIMCKCGREMLKDKFIKLGKCKQCETDEKAEIKRQEAIRLKQERDRQNEIARKERDRQNEIEQQALAAERREYNKRLREFEQDPIKWQKDFDDKQAECQRQFELILPFNLEALSRQQAEKLEEFKHQQPKQLEAFKQQQAEQLEAFKQQQPKQRENYLLEQSEDFKRQQNQRIQLFEFETRRFQRDVEENKSRVYLSVTFSEREAASRMGAVYDLKREQWYAPNGEPELVSKWPVNNDPVVLTGEDREYGRNALYIDLIPSSCWFTNVRSCVHPRDWDRLRRHVYERVNNRCECCNRSW